MSGKFVHGALGPKKKLEKWLEQILTIAEISPRDLKFQSILWDEKSISAFSTTLLK